MQTHTPNRVLTPILSGVIILLLGINAYLGYSLHTSRATLAQIENERLAIIDKLQSTEGTLSTKIRERESMSVLYAELEQRYALAEENNAELLAQLEDEKERNEDFNDQIKDISGTVGKLDKLSKIDKELLQKYSKVYFLNEHFIPEKVVPIPKEFLTHPDDVPEYIHARVSPFLEDLLQDAKDDGVSLLVTSAYRSYDEQRGLKNAYTVQYGTGANTFSADQGYSEHQLGTTLDFTSTEIGGGLTGFQNTEAYAWLQKNAHTYGFTLSYPEGNTYYVYEPWHWRFVGEDLADDLFDDNKSFYDLDQREIDAYLISVFD